MAPPSRNDDENDDTNRRSDERFPDNNDDLVRALGSLKESDIAAVLKRLNIDIVKKEVREGNLDDDEDEDAKDGSSTDFYRTTSSKVLPPKWVKVSTGLVLRSASRTSSELGDVKIVIPKDYRGSKLHDRQKTKKIVTSPLSPKIAGSNIAKILSLADSESYDIAEDASQWSNSIKEIYNHAVKYDIMAIFRIPLVFNISDVNSVATSPGFVNSILAWKDLQDDDCYHWQQFLNLYGSEVDIESDQWMEEFLRASMEQTLKDEVISDFDELSKEHRGAVSLFRCMVNRMVTKNEESRRNLEKWLQDFSLASFSGENVTKACLRIKAVANAIGHDKLPSDVVTRVLNGMATASTDEFSQVCHTQIAMMNNSVLKTMMKVTSLHKQLVSILSDLEVKYLELLGAKKWKGVGIDIKHEVSAYNTFTCDEYRAYVVDAGKNALPFLEWVKTAKCHHCGKTGHIRPMCPQYLEDIKTGKVVRPPFRRNRLPRRPPGKGLKSPNDPPGGPNKANLKEKNQKFRALLSKMSDLMESSDEESDEEQENNANADDDDQTDDANDDIEDVSSAFFSSLGLSKE